MTATVTLDQFVEEIERVGLVGKCLRIAFTKGRKVSQGPKPQDPIKKYWWEIEQNLGGSTFIYDDDQIRIIAHQYVLGGESVTVYARNPRTCVFKVDHCSFHRGFAPIIDRAYKLEEYKGGEWTSHVTEICK